MTILIEDVKEEELDSIKYQLGGFSWRILPSEVILYEPCSELEGLPEPPSVAPVKALAVNARLEEVKMEGRMEGIARQYRELGQYILENFPDYIVAPETVVDVAIKLLKQLKLWEEGIK